MKDFDAVREARRDVGQRMFQIGGETFVRKVGVRPEVLGRYDEISEVTGSDEALALIDSIILDMVDDEGAQVADGDELRWVGQNARARWQAMREREEDPITLSDMRDLVEWLIEAETDRSPTRPSLPSTAGPVPAGVS